jgi:hypothetical protein
VNCSNLKNEPLSVEKGKSTYFRVLCVLFQKPLSCHNMPMVILPLFSPAATLEYAVGKGASLARQEFCRCACVPDSGDIG